MLFDNLRPSVNGTMLLFAVLTRLALLTGDAII